MTRPFLPLFGALLALVVAVPPAGAADFARLSHAPPGSVLIPVCADTTVPPEDTPPAVEVGAHCGPAEVRTGFYGVSIGEPSVFLFLHFDCPLPIDHCPKVVFFLSI